MKNASKKAMGAQASPENKIRYAEEIAKMEAFREKFATNQFGTVNVGAFAARCGFSRFVLEKGALAAQFTADVARIGLAIAVDVPQDRKKAKEKMVRDLPNPSNVKTAEVEILREKVEELTKQVRELQLDKTERNRALEHMLATGERFFL